MKRNKFRAPDDGRLADTRLAAALTLRGRSMSGRGRGERGLEAEAVQERLGFAIRAGALDGETGEVLGQMIFKVEAEED